MEQTNYAETLLRATIAKHNIKEEDRAKMTEKFYIGGIQDAKANRDWLYPSGEVEREFAIDLLIKQLIEVQTSRLGTLVRLSERAIKWLI